MSRYRPDRDTDTSFPTACFLQSFVTTAPRLFLPPETSPSPEPGPRSAASGWQSPAQRGQPVPSSRMVFGGTSWWGQRQAGVGRHRQDGHPRATLTFLCQTCSVHCLLLPFLAAVISWALTPSRRELNTRQAASHLSSKSFLPARQERSAGWRNRSGPPRPCVSRLLTGDFVPVRFRAPGGSHTYLCRGRGGSLVFALVTQVCGQVLRGHPRAGGPGRPGVFTPPDVLQLLLLVGEGPNWVPGPTLREPLLNWKSSCTS